MGHIFIVMIGRIGLAAPYFYACLHAFLLASHPDGYQQTRYQTCQPNFFPSHDITSLLI
jgi:hypothetical protein